eukprot:11807840-Alexandrium_andersonii.AAC.1
MDAPDTPGHHEPDFFGAGRRDELRRQGRPSDVIAELRPAHLDPGRARTLGPLGAPRLLRLPEVGDVLDRGI